jgi:hypothetical protein
MAQLLAGRLRKTNASRARDFESCMSGQIAEIGDFMMRLMEGVKRVDEEQERFKNTLH